MTDSPIADEGRDRRLVNLIYILYFIGFATGLTAFCGVVLAHSKSGMVDAPWQSHLTYQIRTFWLGFAMLLVGGILSIILVGYLVIVWWVIWTLIRCIKGAMAASDGRVIDDPATMMW